MRTKEYIYVLGPDGKPQMPSTRKRHLEQLVKKGKARIASLSPYAIQLLYETPGITQPLLCAEDPGRTNIGISVLTERQGICMQAGITTRNKDIAPLMEERKCHRQASRRGERLARKRLAKAHGTLSTKLKDGRMLPGCKEPVPVKDIRNTEARFLNRKRHPGWLTPTVRQLVQTHVNAVKKLRKFLPITDMAVEVNRFAFALLEDAGLTGLDFQDGPLKGFDDARQAVSASQEGKCLLCGNGIEHIHHIIPKHEGGSDTLPNLVGLCASCHAKVHTDEKEKDVLAKKKAGLLKKYGALSALNQAIPFICAELIKMFGKGHVFFCTGADTKHIRDMLCIVKTKDDPRHVEDAFCIGLAATHQTPEGTPDFSVNRHHIVQFRRHDRAVINSRRERTYRQGKTIVAKNRRPRFEQAGPALSDWFEETVRQHGPREAERQRSQLAAAKSRRYYNDPDRVMPGALAECGGQYFILSQQLTNGQYYRAYGDKAKKNYPARQCRILRRNEGLVFLTDGI